MKAYISNFNLRVKSRDINSDIFSTDGEILLDIMSDTCLFTKYELEMCADPFLFVFDDTLFLFYEKLYTTSGTGYICMKSTNDLKNWSDEVAVLKEDFHLSFPFVFKDIDGEVYMLPECSENGSIRLYKADDSSFKKWSFVKYILQDNNNWVDSSIIKKDDFYFLFTSDTLNGVIRQHIFYSDELSGSFKEHPASPIYCGNDYGRNAGSILYINGDYYRPVQDCSSDYGKQVHVMKITELTTTQYKEELFRLNVIDIKDSFYKFGGHHYNCVQFLGKTIFSSDAKARNYNLFELYKRFMSKIKK